MQEQNKRKALGRGLEDLFNSEPLDYSKVEEKILTETPTDEIVMVNIDELRSNPYQPRKVFDEEALLELSQSIKEHGVFQPIIIKKSILSFKPCRRNSHWIIDNSITYYHFFPYDAPVYRTMWLNQI